jgi:hypothetical protein
MAQNTPSQPPHEELEHFGGEVIAIEEARIRVRLADGKIGFVPRTSGGNARELEVGSRTMFRVVATAPSGETTLAIVESPATPVAGQSFDRDVDRLHNALANHHPTAPARPAERVSIGEEQIRNWVTTVESSLGRIRKNRAKRLNEEFYNS